MAILFEWYENPVPNDQTDPKTIHARITLNGKVGTDEIRHKIQATQFADRDGCIGSTRCTIAYNGRRIGGRTASTSGRHRILPSYTEMRREGITKWKTKRKNEKVKLKGINSAPTKR